jgi:hypothetical protein
VLAAVKLIDAAMEFCDQITELNPEELGAFLRQQYPDLPEQLATLVKASVVYQIAGIEDRIHG